MKSWEKFRNGIELNWKIPLQANQCQETGTTNAINVTAIMRFIYFEWKTGHVVCRYSSATGRSDGLSHHLSMKKFWRCFRFSIFEFVWWLHNSAWAGAVTQLDILLAVNFAPSTIWHTLNRQNRQMYGRLVYTAHPNTYTAHNAIHIHPVASFMPYIIWSNSSVLIVMRPIYARFSDTLPDIKLYPHQNVTTISTHAHK